MAIPQHVFISYSHKNLEFAKRFADDLEEARIPKWIDEDIPSETSDFYKKIDEAIQESFVLIYVASPEARNSNFIGYELRRAAQENTPIIILWIDGLNDIDAIPPEYSRHQHIDCRDGKYETARPKIIEDVKRLREEKCPPHMILDNYDKLPAGYAGIRLFHNNRHFVFRPESYSKFEDLATELFMEFLHSQFPPYSYGKEWLIVGDEPLDINQAIYPNIRLGKFDESKTYLMATSLEDLSIQSGTKWKIEDRITGHLVVTITKSSIVSQKLNRRSVQYITKKIGYRSRPSGELFTYDAKELPPGHIVTLFSDKDKFAYLNNQILLI